jgi:hypothetical protein
MAIDISDKLSRTMYRLLDVLEAAEENIKHQNTNLELVLAVNQAKISIKDLELVVNVDLKTFLKKRMKTTVAKREKMN